MPSAVLTILATVASIISPALSAANSLLTISEPFGPNPTNVTFNLYLPSTLQTKPPILVNPHWCHGSASACFMGTQLATLADKYGYIMIFPDSPNTVDKCWDVSSNQTLMHNGGGDSLGIVSMVKWTLQKYDGDPNRVFVMGTSSGAMMTNVLLGSYPDVFAAGSAWAGVAFGCFAGDGYDVWSDACATGKIMKSGTEWKGIVDAAYPGFNGTRPKMQVFHGLNDTTLYPQNLQEEIKEWTSVLGVNGTATRVEKNWFSKGWTTSWYGSKFMATSAEGVTHDIKTNETAVLAWFDLKCRDTGCFSKNSRESRG